MKSKATRAPRRRRPPSLPAGPAVTLARHRARCHICRHPDREEIERDFLDWVPAREIAETYKLTSPRVVYRHADAFDLFDMRRGYVERVLDNLIERSGEAKITAGAVVSAVRLMIDINAGSDWISLKAMRSPLPAKPGGGAAGQSAALRQDEREEDGKRAPRAATAARDDGNGEGPWAGASAQLRRALQAPNTAAPPPETPLMIVDPSADKSGRNADPTPSSSKEARSGTKTAKPSASADSTPAAPEPGSRREPDGRVEVAGMAWPWPKGRTQLARRGRWRGRRSPG